MFYSNYSFMKNFICLICLVVSGSLYAQNEKSQTGLHPSFSKIYNTNIKVADYRPAPAKTIYDLALNLSYLHALNEINSPPVLDINHSSEPGKKNAKYLVMPLVLNDGIPYSEEDLKYIDINELSGYEYHEGIQMNALYGTRGSHGVLKIILK